jgi:multiple sugar transport system permease protein
MAAPAMIAFFHARNAYVFAVTFIFTPAIQPG